MLYDLLFFALFTIFVIIFLYRKRENLERQGILYLYRTKLGIKFIDIFAKRFKKILKPLQYVVICLGYVLMAGIIWLLGKSIYLYIREPGVSQLLGKTPPLAPLIPYFPKLFGLESFFPPLYFTYFLIALAVVAIVHEFSHGIFARLNKLKIHSTGFAFLGPILGAFVEQDEKQMEKAKKFPQLAILGAGVFANVVVSIIFCVVMVLFFVGTFSPAGVVFQGYAFSEINLEGVVLPAVEGNESFVELNVDGAKYFAGAKALEKAKEKGYSTLLVYDDTPAFEVGLIGAISEIDGVKINNIEELSTVIKSHKPGDNVLIRTLVKEDAQDTNPYAKDFVVELGEREGIAYLGILSYPIETRGAMGWFYENIIMKYKNPQVLYESSWGEFGWFVYYLLWWLVVINILVALFNMLPLGILDGGRFFYLTVWGITGNEKVGRIAFKTVTWLILLFLALMMFKWLFLFF